MNFKKHISSMQGDLCLFFVKLSLFYWEFACYLKNYS